MLKTKIAISSWGNIGQAIALIHEEEAARDPNHDMELVGIIRRSAKAEDGGYPKGVAVVSDVNALKSRPDVILCAAPSHTVMEDVEKYLKLGFCTVDCFDNHKEINPWRERLNLLVEKNAPGAKAVSIISSGWDPGFDSIQRALAGLVAPGGEVVTTFGPGRSMGHTTTVKSLHPDIREAVALTLPGAKPGLQKREVYIQLNDALAGKDVQEKITKSILAHPYFKNDDSHVFFTQSIAPHDTKSHGGVITCKAGKAEVSVKLHGDNPAMTAGAMYASARAAKRAKDSGRYGCFTMVELTPIDFIKGDTIAQRLARIKY